MSRIQSRMTCHAMNEEDLKLNENTVNRLQHRDDKDVTIIRQRFYSSHGKNPSSSNYKHVWNKCNNWNAKLSGGSNSRAELTRGMSTGQQRLPRLSKMENGLEQSEQSPILGSDNKRSNVHVTRLLEEKRKGKSWKVFHGGNGWKHLTFCKRVKSTDSIS